MDKERLRTNLRAETADTERVIITYNNDMKPIAPDNAIGRVSRMGAIVNQGVTRKLLNEAQDRLKKLKYVLSRIDEPDFGLCKRCNQPIPEARFLIVPEAIYCVKCAN
jgi:DnaK suppressor protein